jgi:hypothetical protein
MADTDVLERVYVPPRTPEQPPAKKPVKVRIDDGYVPPKSPIPPPPDKKKRIR